jgi:Tfp pilus assembly protein FimV
MSQVPPVDEELARILVEARLRTAREYQAEREHYQKELAKRDVDVAQLRATLRDCEASCLANSKFAEQLALTIRELRAALREACDIAARFADEYLGHDDLRRIDELRKLVAS